nr:MAG TPA: hypothetical protein [Caudoviricetes sp.]
MTMIKCVCISVEDYQGAIHFLKSAKESCETARLQRFSATGASNYYLNEIERQIELVEDLLKKEGL